MRLHPPSTPNTVRSSRGISLRICSPLNDLGFQNHGILNIPVQKLHSPWTFRRNLEGHLDLPDTRIIFPGFWKDGCMTPLAYLPGWVARHCTKQLTWFPGACLLVTTLPHCCSRSEILPIHSPALKPSMAPCSPWDKAHSLSWHLQHLLTLRLHYPWSPTLKTAQHSGLPATHHAAAILAAPSTWNPCLPLLLATSLSSFKPSVSTLSSRQPSLLPPVITLAESSLGPQHHLAKGQAQRTGPHPRFSQGHPPSQETGQQPARPSAPGDPAPLADVRVTFPRTV